MGVVIYGFSLSKTTLNLINQSHWPTTADNDLSLDDHLTSNGAPTRREIDNQLIVNIQVGPKCSTCLQCGHCTDNTLNHSDAGAALFGTTCHITRLLMPWSLVSLGSLQPWQWICKTDGPCHPRKRISTTFAVLLIENTSIVLYSQKYIPLDHAVYHFVSLNLLAQCAATSNDTTAPFFPCLIYHNLFCSAYI